MTRLCLTNAWGTSNLGLYRGLCRKVLGTPYAVAIACSSPERSIGDATPPLLLAVQLSREQIVQLNAVRMWRVPPGVAHAVVLLGVDDEGLAVVGDPFVGRVRYPREVLETAYRDLAYRLVPR